MARIAREGHALRPPIHQRHESGLLLFISFIFLLLQVFNVNGFGGLEDALDKVRDVLVDKNRNRIMEKFAY